MVSTLDTENRILASLLARPLESKSMHQIAKDTGLSYVTVSTVVPFLIRKKVLLQEKKGKAHLISLHLESAPLEKISSALLYQREAFLHKHPSLLLFVRELEETLSDSFYCLVLFGSYARGTYNARSDVDLLFILPQRIDIEGYRKKILPLLRLHPLPKKECQFVSCEEFLDMLNQKYSLGREVLTSGLVLYGAEYYYSLVKKYVRTKGY